PIAADVQFAADDEDLAERMQEFVYGTISTMVVIGALDAKQLGSARSAILVVVGTAIATWLAHTFAAVIGAHVRARRAVKRNEIATKFRRSWRIVTASIPATLALLGAGVGLFSLRTALFVATFFGVVQLVAVGVFAARRSEFTRSGVIAYAATA